MRILLLPLGTISGALSGCLGTLALGASVGFLLGLLEYSGLRLALAGGLFGGLVGGIGGAIGGTANRLRDPDPSLPPTPPPPVATVLAALLGMLAGTLVFDPYPVKSGFLMVCGLLAGAFGGEIGYRATDLLSRTIRRPDPGSSRPGTRL